MLSVVPGARTAENAEAVVADVKERTEGRPLRLMTSDAYPAYQEAILQVYGTEVTTTPTGRDSKRMVPEKVPPPELTYATVEKKRRLGRVVEILVHLIFGTMAALARALRLSKVSRKVNTSFLERYNATDRHRNARKVRKTYTFSNDWQVHESMTYFTIYSYNFCWSVRTLNERSEDVKGFKLLPHRWVVERTFAWLGRFRRMSKDYEFNTSTSEAMIHLAMINIMTRRLASA